MCFNGNVDAALNLVGKSITGKCLNTVSHMFGAVIKLYSCGSGSQIQHAKCKKLMNICTAE